MDAVIKTVTRKVEFTPAQLKFLSLQGIDIAQAGSFDEEAVSITCTREEADILRTALGHFSGGATSDLYLALDSCIGDETEFKLHEKPSGSVQVLHR